MYAIPVRLGRSCPGSAIGRPRRSARPAAL